MKTRFVLLFCLLAAGVATAHELVTNVVVRQRRPWSNVVDIDYLYTGLCPTSMAVTATWEGQTTPVSLVSLTSEGVGGVTLGQHTLTWDPSAAGYGDATLKNFKVEISPTAQDLRTYLVIDLENGGYSLMASAPDGGWTDEYKTKKLVLKRLYKGTYRWGTSEYGEYRPAFGDLGQPGAIGRGSALHDVTYTSDYYFPIFELTVDQNSWIVNGRASDSSTPTHPYNQSTSQLYSFFRGVTLDDGTTAVNWPKTGHKVNSASFIGKLRAITSKTGQGELLADLPTVDQWQLPMCGGRNTFWPNGGTAAERYDENYDWTNWNSDSRDWTKYPLPQVWYDYMDAISWRTDAGGEGWQHPVGQKNPNDWGFYDFLINWNPCLNWINASETVDSSFPRYLDRGDRTDDVGPEEPTPFTGAQEGKIFRLACGQNARDLKKPGYETTIFARQKIDVGDPQGLVFLVPRIVVNLKPLVNVD